MFSILALYSFRYEQSRRKKVLLKSKFIMICWYLETLKILLYIILYPSDLDFICIFILVHAHYFNIFYYISEIEIIFKTIKNNNFILLLRKEKWRILPKWREFKSIIFFLMTISENCFPEIRKDDKSEALAKSMFYWY